MATQGYPEAKSAFSLGLLYHNGGVKQPLKPPQKWHKFPPVRVRGFGAEVMDSCIHLSIQFTGDTSDKLFTLREVIGQLHDLEKVWGDLAQGEQRQQEVFDALSGSHGVVMAAESSSPYTPDTSSAGGSEGSCCGPQGRIRKAKRVDEYEAILVRHGGPMHLREITDAALSVGIDLSGGTSTPDEKVRNSLYGSKRFVNEGANRWWLSGKPLPADDDYQDVDL